MSAGDLAVNCINHLGAEDLLKLVIRNAIDCSPYVDCHNKDDSWPSIIKRLIVIDEDGNLALNVCGCECEGGGGGRTVRSQTEEIIAVNTMVETDLYSFDVPAGTLLLDAYLSGIFNGTIFNNSGSTVTITWRVYFGSTLMYQCQSADIPDSENIYPFTMDFQMYPFYQNANIQLLSGKLMVAGASTTPATGFGDLREDPNLITNFQGQSSESGAAANTLRVTVALSAANANFYCVSQFRQIEY